MYLNIKKNISRDRHESTGLENVAQFVLAKCFYSCMSMYAIKEMLRFVPPQLTFFLILVSEVRKYRKRT